MKNKIDTLLNNLLVFFSGVAVAMLGIMAWNLIVQLIARRCIFLALLLGALQCAGQEPLYPQAYFRLYTTHLQYDEFTGELNYNDIPRKEFLVSWWSPKGAALRWRIEVCTPRAPKMWFRPQPAGYRSATGVRWASIQVTPGFRYRFVPEVP